MFKIVESELPKAELIIIGDGPDRKFCEDYVSTNNLKNVKLLGNLSYEDTLGHIAESTMIVQPSNEEAFGRVIMEGYQFEKPAVAHSIGHFPRYIENGKNGILVPPGNPEKFAQAVLKLAHDKKLRNKMGKNGKKFLEEQPTWNDLAGDVYKIYKDLWDKGDK
jgi:glycosyltransferase involved in cell wall biosynthesis